MPTLAAAIEPAALAFAVMLFLMLLGVPIGFAMLGVGFVGYGLIASWDAAWSMLGRTAFDSGRSFDLSIVPLFILMGNVVFRAGLSSELYEAAFRWVGHFRGGLAQATILSCAAFSSICGSSLATAATMSKVAIPPMRRFHYSDKLAAGAVAAGGTLGILIPPSVILAIYGVMTRTDIGKLFIAGILPGILGIVLYNAAIWVTTRRNPEAGPAAERASWSVRWRALGAVWPIGILFLVVIGGIYSGAFTPTESAAVGASGAFVLAFARRRLSLRGAWSALVETVETTAMIIFLLIGALVFSNFINECGLGEALTTWIKQVAVSPTVLLLLIVAIYIVLGAVLESLSMLLLTVPLFFPVVSAVGVDPVWFGILVVVVIEISLITPPVGMNLFVLNAILPDIEARAIFAGVMPFVVADIVRLAIILFVPGIALLLPSLMG